MEKKAAVELFKQTPFLGDILIPASLAFHDAHTDLAHLQAKTLSQAIVNYHAHHSGKLQ